MVLPNQAMDTFAAVAQKKGISQDGTWWGWTGIDIDDPTLAGEVQAAIKNHKGNQNVNPTYMRDVAPGEARTYWLGMNLAKQEETFNRMSYAYANWAKGDNFYVITKSRVDVVRPYPDRPGHFGAFELPYLTKYQQEMGRHRFGAVYRINIQNDGSAVVLPEPYWKAPDPQPVNEPQPLWLLDNSNLDPNPPDRRAIHSKL